MFTVKVPDVFAACALPKPIPAAHSAVAKISFLSFVMLLLLPYLVVRIPFLFACRDILTTSFRIRQKTAVNTCKESVSYRKRCPDSISEGQLPYRTWDAMALKAASALQHASQDVLGFSGVGTFSSTIVNRPVRPVTRIVCVFNVSAGSATTRRRLRAKPTPPPQRAPAMLTLSGKHCTPSPAGPL